MRRLKIIIAGASGYTGGELTRILLEHPQAEIVGFTSSTAVGEPVTGRLPLGLGRNFPAATFQDLSTVKDEDCDVVFFATSHGVAMREAAALLEAGKVVIDLGADFRLQCADTFKKWYGEHCAPDLLSQAVYGLPELHRDKIRAADLIACPGCYATAAELALMPLVAAGIIEGRVIIDAKSGVSGAGRRGDRPELLLAEMSDNFKAYALDGDGHRHLPEILQTLQTAAGAPPPAITFVPHLLPTARGIHANIYAPLAAGDAAKDVAATLSNHWAKEPFVEILPAGKTAELRDVLFTNRAILSVHPLDAPLTLVSVVIDNLVKGAAGQAVQNMNIRFGLDERLGLAGARRHG